jgi:uncharacterized membrane protein YheB (UPF0754 family)
MQITRKQLKEIISEEMEKISEESDGLDTLLENYAAAYNSNEQYVDKQALIDFLEVMDGNKIPKDLFENFMHNLPEKSVTDILSEVVTSEE